MRSTLRTYARRAAQWSPIEAEAEEAEEEAQDQRRLE